MVLSPPTCSITGDHRMQRRCLKQVLYWGHPHARHRRGRSLAQRIQEWMNQSNCLPLSPDTLRTALLPVGNMGCTRWHIHLYRLQLPGVPFSAGHHMMVVQELCNHANLYLDPGAHSFYSKVHARVLSCFSRVQLYMTLWTTACQAPLPMGFSRQKYWSRLPCPPPGDLPDPRIEFVSACVSCIADRFFIH